MRLLHSSRTRLPRSIIQFRDRIYGGVARVYRSIDHTYVLKVFDRDAIIGDPHEEWNINVSLTGCSATPIGLVSFENDCQLAILVSYEGRPRPFGRYSHIHRFVDVSLACKIDFLLCL